MTGKERVRKVINREKPDRIPIYAWVNNADFCPKIIGKYGSIAAFDDKYEFDLNHLFPPCVTFLNAADSFSSQFFEDDIPEIIFSNPDDMPYKEVKKTVDYLSEEKGRFVYAQTPGCFEHFNGVFGIENHLAYLLLHTDRLFELYGKLADWTIVYANNLIDIGVDMIHISDDWGAQNSAMFNRGIWDKLIYPYHKKVAEAVRKRGAYLSLHSDGNVSALLDGICEIGFDVVHPHQESAGMSYDTYWKKYKDNFVIMGGLDIQSTLGFRDYNNVENEIRRVLNTFKDGNLLFCTTHMIQPHCSLEEAEFAMDLVYNLIREK